MSERIHSSADRARLIEQLIDEHARTWDGPTKSLLATAFSEALRCGDFIRQVNFPSGSIKIVYKPYARECELLARLDEVTRLIAALCKTTTEDAESEAGAKLEEWWKQNYRPP
jgi:hypothetical protein